MKNNTHQLIYGLITLVILFGVSLPSSAQVGQQMERIKAERVGFFTEKMGLTKEEAEKFWPVYNDYNNRKERLNEEGRLLLRFVGNNIENMDDEEIDEYMQKYIKIQDKSHELFVEYNEKFLKILSPSKVLKLYITETQFKRYLLDKIGEARRARQDNRNF